MQIFVRNGYLIATHSDSQVIDPTAYPGCQRFVVPDDTTFEVNEDGIQLAPDLTDTVRKEELIYQVERIRKEKIAEGYERNFGASAGIRTMPYATVEQVLYWAQVSNRVIRLLSKGETDTIITLYDADGEAFETSATTADIALTELDNWSVAITARAYELKNQILAGDLNVNINQGWPA